MTSTTMRPALQMKPRHILTGIIGLTILACWCLVSMAINWVFKGVAFDD